MDERRPPPAEPVDPAAQPSGERGAGPRGSTFRRFIGISLGGGRGKNTAVARLEPSGDGGQLVIAEARTREAERGGGELDGESPGAPFRDAELVRWLERWVDDETLVAIDAPLSLPVCVRCQLECPGFERCEVPVVAWMRRWGPQLRERAGRSDPKKPHVTPYTQRATELVLEHLTLQPREALGQGMGPLAARAAYLRRVMASRLRVHENLIEVHPRATLIRAFGIARERETRVGDTSDALAARRQALFEFSEGLRFDRVWPDLVVRRVQVFHALVCAFTALSYAAEGRPSPLDSHLGRGHPLLGEALRALGDEWREDGWIYAPAPPRVVGKEPDRDR